MYFLTMIETNRNSHECTSSAAVGYFKTYEEVVEILHSNYCDINETCYDYAVVEQIRPGLYPCPEKTVFFKYDPDKNGYFETCRPKMLNNMGNFAIG